MRMVLTLTALMLGTLAPASYGQGTAAQASERAVLRIAREVQKAVVTLPNYGVFDDIRFAIKGYDVTLKGLASRPTLKSSIEQVVKKIEGVEKVVNEIEVLPLSRQDDDIRLATYLRIYGHPALSRYNPNRGSPLFTSRTTLANGITNDPPPGFHPVHIVVKNGNVTLEGVLDTVVDRTVAELQANGTPGVFSVTNNIVVSNQDKMKDMGRKAKAK